MNTSSSTPRVNGSNLRLHIGQIVILIGEVISVNYGKGGEISCAVIRSGDNIEVNVSLPNGEIIASFVISYYIFIYYIETIYKLKSIFLYTQ